MRRSTRVRVDIPVKLRSLDPKIPFDLLSRALVVNAQGCGLQTDIEIPADTLVEVCVDDRVESGRTLNSTLVDAARNIWVVGVELKRAGNLWGIQSPPADWLEAQEPPAKPASSPSARVHPFARRKSPTPVVVPAPAQPAPPANGAEELRGRFDALLQEFRERLRTQAADDWERWRSDASAALQEVQKQLSSELAADAASWRQQTQHAADKLSALIKSSEAAGHAAQEHGQQVRSIAAAAQTEITTAIDQLQKAAAAARQSSSDTAQEIARLKSELLSFEIKAPALVEVLVKEQAERSMSSMDGRIEKEVSSAVAAGLEQLQQTVREMSNAAESSVRTRLLADFAERQESFLASSAAQLAEIRTRESSFRSAADELISQLSRHAEAAMAGLRIHIQELVSRHEAEVISRLTVRHDEIAHRLDLESERLAALHTAAEKALQAIDERQQAAARVESDIARAADAALEKIDTRHAAAHTDIEKASAESLEKMHAGFEAGRQNLEAALQQQAWDYQAQAEAASGRLQDRLTAALKKLDADIEQKQGTLTSAVAADMAAERERQVAALRQQIENERREYDADFEVKKKQSAASLAELEARRNQLGGELLELQRTKEHVAALLAALPDTVRSHAQQAASEAWNDLRSRSEQHISETMQAEAQRGSQRVLDEISVAARQLREEMAARAEETAAHLQNTLAEVLSTRQQQVAGELQNQIAELEARAATAVGGADEKLRHSTAQLNSAAESAAARVKEAAANASTELSRQAELQAAQHRAAADAVHEAARRRLEEVAANSEHLLGETEAALLKTAGEVASEEIERARREVRESARKESDAAIAGFQAESAKVTADRVAAVAATVAEAGAAAERLAASQTAAEERSKALQEQLAVAQQWLGEHTAEFQKTVHDAFLQAGGEIRGRVHAAVDSADEMIRQKSKDAMASVESASAQHVQALARQAQETQHKMADAASSATASAEALLKSRLAETLDLFRNDAERLAQSALSRWQSAMDDTLRSIPDLLREKLQPEAPSQKPAAADQR